MCRLLLLRYSFWFLWVVRFCMDRKFFSLFVIGLNIDGRMRYC